MTGKTSILAAAAAVALVAGAGAASAQVFAPGAWYAKGFGGATWPSGETEDVTFRGTTVGEIGFDYDTGYVLGAALGYNYTPNFAFELEYAFRQADLKGDASGDTRSNAFMLNALYKFSGMGPTGAIQPYVGGGLGWADIDVQTENQGSFDNDSLFAWQLIGGVGYEVSPSWTLLGEVRWYATESGDLNGRVNGRELSTSSAFESFDLLVGASYSF